MHFSTKKTLIFAGQNAVLVIWSYGKHTITITKGLHDQTSPPAMKVHMFGLTYILCFRRLVSIWQASPGSPPTKVCMYVCMSKHTYVETMGMYVCLGVPRKK